MRKPWFHVIEVWEPGGRSMADIVNDVVRETGVSLAEIRSLLQFAPVCKARNMAYLRIRAERRDLTSGEVAHFLRKDGSTIRRAWRKAA